MIADLVALHAAAEKGTFMHPYYVGGLVLIILFAALLALLAMGRGREHS